MKKFLIAMVGAAFLAITPMAAVAQSCYPFEQAKADVAKIDPIGTWEYLKEGPKFNALLVYIKKQLGPNYVAKVDGVLISRSKGSDGKDYVMWALSANGQCVDMATFQVMSPKQFDQLFVGVGI